MVFWNTKHLSLAKVELHYKIEDPLLRVAPMGLSIIPYYIYKARMLVVICSILSVLFVDELLAVLNNNAFEILIYLLASKVVHWSILVLNGNEHSLDAGGSLYKFKCVIIH